MESFVALLRNFGQIFQSWAIVAPWELALRVRLGRHVRQLQPGVHLRIPFVDTVHKQSVRLRVTNLRTQTVVTKDGRPLTLAGTLGYAVADIERLYQTLHHAEDTIENIAQQALAGIAEESDSANISPGWLCERTTARIRSRLGRIRAHPG